MAEPGVVSISVFWSIVLGFGFVTFKSQLIALGLWAGGLAIGLLAALFGATVTIFMEHSHIEATKRELFEFILSIPLFTLSQIPISFVAIFTRPSWKPIQHEGRQELAEHMEKKGKEVATKESHNTKDKKQRTEVSS